MGDSSPKIEFAYISADRGNKYYAVSGCMSDNHTHRSACDHTRVETRYLQSCNILQPVRFHHQFERHKTISKRYKAHAKQPTQVLQRSSHHRQPARQSLQAQHLRPHRPYDVDHVVHSVAQSAVLAGPVLTLVSGLLSALYPNIHGLFNSLKKNAIHARLLSLINPKPTFANTA